MLWDRKPRVSIPTTKGLVGVGKLDRDGARELVPSQAPPNSQVPVLSIILDGLIGPRAEVPVKVNGHQCVAILDSESQGLFYLSLFMEIV